MSDKATRSYLGEMSRTFAPTPDQVEDLLAATGSERSKSGIRGRALILTLYATGARISEVLSMRRMDLDQLGDATGSDPRIRLWRSKRRPEGRPRDAKAARAWGVQRKGENLAFLEDLAAKSAAGDREARAALAWVELVALHREREPWDIVGRGRPEGGVPLRGSIGQRAAAALRRWLHERDKLEGSRTPHAPLWVTTRKANNPVRDGRATEPGAVLTAPTFRVWLSRRADLAGLGAEVERVEGRGRRFHPHHLRHASAAALWKRTHDLQTVKRHLGHRDQATTEVYLRSLEVMDDALEPEVVDPLAVLESMSEDELRRTLAGLLSGAKAR